MSKKVMALEVENFDAEDDVGLFYKTIVDCMCNELLVLLSCKGLYYLVPHEIMGECATTLDQHRNSLEVFNTLPSIVITRKQCIPISSETAKILLEL